MLARFYRGSAACLGPVMTNTRERFPPEEFEHQQFSADEFDAPEHGESK
jgi:hypothetical protein